MITTLAAATIRCVHRQKLMETWCRGRRIQQTLQEQLSVKKSNLMRLVFLVV